MNLIGGMGVIESPNYPRIYPSNLVCTYSITAPAGATIEFVFEEVDLQEDSRCRWDYVEILQGFSFGQVVSQ